MIEQLDKESLRIACAALRAAIAIRARGDLEMMHAPLRALTGLEHAAFNAPQNQGWLRKRTTELRNALSVLSGADDLQLLYKNIETILQCEPRQRQSIDAKRWFPGGRF